MDNFMSHLRHKIVHHLPSVVYPLAAGLRIELCHSSEVVRQLQDIVLV